jgi:TctA family transporter
MLDYSFWLLLGTLYGFIIGIIPVAGAATGLVILYSFLDLFRADPYTLVIFTTAIVVASTIGDSFSSVVMNIPGASGSAATMVDGFPMAQRGEGARALSAAITTSTVNGIIWGGLVFLFLPYYSKVILSFGIPEMLAFILLAFTCICFVSNGPYWFRGIIAAIIGIFLGLVGQDPTTTAARFTGGWEYLKNGIQIMPVLAGFLAFPELLEAYNSKKQVITLTTKNIWSQIRQGFVDTWIHKWHGFKGGVIGAVVGILPGIGGNVADWLAYGQTVASNKNEKIAFGDGNVKGVIGCEGANNAQKATAYVPTVLFGIPAAPFEAIIMSLFIMVGIELGSPQLLADMTFFKLLGGSYFVAMILTFFLSLIFIRYAIKIMNVPFHYYFWPLMALITWSCVQYTGYWEDYAIFALCCVAGVLFKYFKLSRAAVIIGFVLADRFEASGIQFLTLYNWTDLFTRPISATLMLIAAIAIIYGVFFNKTQIKYV